MRLVEWPVGTDGQAHAVQRQGIVFSDGRQVAMGRAASAHVVFRMNFKEAHIRPRFDDGSVVVGLKAYAGSRRDSPPGGVRSLVNAHVDPRCHKLAGGATGHRPPR
ncbi:hypothetical protein G6F40_015094 [Rhizopus arrhizus]|nr:hypothetical protein G6F40_015094 [Rhizopus arrhizus]KAG1254654.1 hypothetical protein G6F65_016954 [Rhizopus arrhizus]